MRLDCRSNGHRGGFGFQRVAVGRNRPADGRMMMDNPKKTKWFNLLLNFMAAAALGSIVSLPWVIKHESRSWQRAYYAVESCKAGADLDVCKTLRGDQ
jgi:hypothetical protein